ncbi:MAG: iron-siderophore ABC transporter substrate-binding protein [Actinomycetota bacterium]|nr:iron-siderophore ABC transporter substrate-binding protein [Actinomycetota bacterium]
MQIRRTFAVLAAGLALTACGTTEEAADSAQDPTAQEPGAQPAYADGPVTLTDARGAHVSLDAPATEVVALEWNAVEHLVSLDVMPVGAADVEGYNNWVSVEPLDDSVTDVGVRGEPSAETIGGLGPDLIVTTTDYEASVTADFEERGIAVLVLESADASRGIEQMRENLELVAEATGTQERAARLLADFDKKLAQGRAAVEKAGAAGDPFFMTDGYLTGGQLSIRPYAEGSLLSDTFEKLGLRNAWQQEGDQMYGLSSTDVEGLTALPDDVTFLYMANGADDPFADGLQGNDIWESFEFVQDGDVHRLPDGLWMFGGPTSMGAFVDAVIDVMA